MNLTLEYPINLRLSGHPFHLCSAGYIHKMLILVILTLMFCMAHKYAHPNNRSHCSCTRR
jgi:hypothetical protein